MYDVCCAWHLLCFPSFYVPVPVGHLGICVCYKVVWKILLSEPSDLSYWGPESYQVLLSWQRDRINPSKAAGVERASEDQ